MCPVVNIAAVGDIFLAVGPEKSMHRVQWIFLKAAWKLLGTIFGSNCRESHDVLGAGLPVGIPLPEKDAIALTCIRAILHQSGQISTSDHGWG
jgi:hypothetical protein